MANPLLSDGAGLLDITIVNGIRFQKILTYKANGSTPVDLTGYTIAGKIYQNDGVTVLATFTITLVDEDNGKFKVYLSSATTAGIPVGQWFYYIEAEEPGGDVFLLLKGTAIVREA